MRSKNQYQEQKTMSQELTECPECQAIWSLDEIQFQECDACEYQAPQDDEDPNDLIPPDLSGQGNTFGTGINLNWN